MGSIGEGIEEESTKPVGEQSGDGIREELKPEQNCSIVLL